MQQCKKIIISSTILIIIIQLMLLNYFQETDSILSIKSSTLFKNGKTIDEMIVPSSTRYLQTISPTARSNTSGIFLSMESSITKGGFAYNMPGKTYQTTTNSSNTNAKSYAIKMTSLTVLNKIAVTNLSSLKSSNMKQKLVLSLNEVHKKIWDQIEALQDKGNCEDKKILHCEPDNFAGFGSMLSKYSACMQVAFALGRMFFIYQPEYAHFGGLSQWLLPESRHCQHLKRNMSSYDEMCSFHDPKCFNGFEINNNYKVLTYHKIGYPGPRRIPGTIPKNVEDVLKKHHVEDPKMWFTAQFLGYLVLRLNSKYKKFYENIKRNLNLQYPYVAMHLRHGDKLNWEARYIPEQIFADKAQQYFNENYPNLNKPNVFLATDDEDVPKYLSSLFPETYHLMMLPKGYRAKGFSSYINKKFPKEVVGTMLMDLYFLAFSNFTICTFSSNIGRIVYLLRQAIYPSRAISQGVLSLDSSFYHDFFGFRYEPTGVTYFLSIRENTHTVQQTNYYSILKYRPGELFRVAKEQYSSSTMVLVERNWWTNSKELGLVYMKDMKDWLNYPEYFFYQ